MPNWKKVITSGSNAELNNLTVTEITASSAQFNSVPAGTDNTVLIIDNNGNVLRDEIDSKVWDGNLVDKQGTPIQYQIAIFNDADTLIASPNLTFDNSILSITGNVTATSISASLFSGSFVGDGSNLTGIEGITTSSLLTTASVSLNTITFTKGDASTFDITVDTGSGGGGAAFPYTGSAEISGSLTVTGSLNVYEGLTSLYKSGSTVFNIEGSQGTLFTVTDELSGSLFSVNDISGIPIFEVFSDNTLKLGTYNAEELIVSESMVILSQVSESLDFADDVSAATGGVPLGGLYHNSGAVRIRLT
jgi:hypothetical protein